MEGFDFIFKFKCNYPKLDCGFTGPQPHKLATYKCATGTFAYGATVIKEVISEDYLQIAKLFPCTYRGIFCYTENSLVTSPDKC